MGIHPQIIITVPGNAPKSVLSRKASKTPKESVIAIAEAIAVFLPNFLRVCVASVPAKKKSPKPNDK